MHTFVVKQSGIFYSQLVHKEGRLTQQPLRLNNSSKVNQYQTKQTEFNQKSEVKCECWLLCNCTMSLRKLKISN